MVDASHVPLQAQQGWNWPSRDGEDLQWLYTRLAVGLFREIKAAEARVSASVDAIDHPPFEQLPGFSIDADAPMPKTIGFRIRGRLIGFEISIGDATASRVVRDESALSDAVNSIFPFAEGLVIEICESDGGRVVIEYLEDADDVLIRASSEHLLASAVSTRESILKEFQEHPR